MLLASVIGPVLVGLGGTSFFVAPWLPRLLVGAGLTLLVGFSLILLFVLPFELVVGVLGWFGLYRLRHSGLLLGYRRLIRLVL